MIDEERKQNTSGWQHSFDFLKFGNQNMQIAKPGIVKKKYEVNSGKNVACQMCPKILANKKNLKEHMLRRHSEPKTVVCKYCAKFQKHKYQTQAVIL